MKNENFIMTVKKKLEEVTNLLVKKNKEYSYNCDDRLHTFKRVGDLTCTSSKQALAGMMAKHVASIFQMCYSDDEFSQELWNEKINDNICYLLLLNAIMIENHENQLGEKYEKN